MRIWAAKLIPTDNNLPLSSRLDPRICLRIALGCRSAEALLGSGAPFADSASIAVVAEIKVTGLAVVWLTDRCSPAPVLPRRGTRGEESETRRLQLDPYLHRPGTDLTSWTTKSHSPCAARSWPGKRWFAPD